MSISDISKSRVERALAQLDSERRKYTELGRLARHEGNEIFAKSYFEAANDIILVSNIVENAKTESENKLCREMEEYISAVESMGLQIGNIVTVDGSNQNPYFVTKRGFVDSTGTINNFIPGALIDKVFDWKCVGFFPNGVMLGFIYSKVWCTDVLQTKEPVECIIDSYCVKADDQVMVVLATTVNGMNWTGEFLVCDANGQSDIGRDVFKSRDAALKTRVS